MTTTERKYRNLIAGIDVSVASTEDTLNLRDRVEASASQNADDTVAELGLKPNSETGIAAWYTAALSTALMILDSWEEYYPELVKEN